MLFQTTSSAASVSKRHTALASDNRAPTASLACRRQKDPARQHHLQHLQGLTHHLQSLEGLRQHAQRPTGNLQQESLESVRPQPTFLRDRRPWRWMPLLPWRPTFHILFPICRLTSEQVAINPRPKCRRVTVFPSFESSGPGQVCQRTGAATFIIQHMHFSLTLYTLLRCYSAGIALHYRCRYD